MDYVHGCTVFWHKSSQGRSTSLSYFSIILYKNNKTIPFIIGNKNWLPLFIQVLRLITKAFPVDAYLKLYKHFIQIDAQI